VLVISPGPSFCLAAGRGAYAIRALCDVCFGITSERQRAPYMTLEAVVPVTDDPAANLLALAGWINQV
jgi:hypothetical protein